MDNVEIIKQWLVEKGDRIYDLDLASRLNRNTSASLDTTVGAKSAMHPLLREILRVLWTSGKDSPKEISAALDAALGVVSYHVRMLKDYGTVEVSRTEPRRVALQHYYRLTEDGRQLCLELFGPAPTS